MACGSLLTALTDAAPAPEKTVPKAKFSPSNSLPASLYLTYFYHDDTTRAPNSHAKIAMTPHSSIHWSCPQPRSLLLPFIIGTLQLLLSSGCQTSNKELKDGRDARQIYDMGADGELLLNAGMSRARDEDKRVLLSLGANWCSDSQKTHDVLQNNEAIRSLIDQAYVVTMIDVNNRIGHQRNASIIERYEVSLDRGIPALLVLTPEGELLSTDAEQRPQDSDHKHPERILAYLEEWSPTGLRDSAP